MTINRDLFLAILSMDSYNRGYGQGINNLEVVIGQTRLGNAVISNQVDIGRNSAAIAASFYAIAYQIGEGPNAERIISYRGTDNLNPFGVTSSEYRSFDIGAGDPFNDFGTGLDRTAQLTVDFYQAVVGAGNDPFAANITLTGHSLGGGLATNDNEAVFAKIAA